MRFARARAAAAPVLLGLLLVGCGGGSDDRSGTSAAQQPAGASDLSEFDFGDNEPAETAEVPMSDEVDEPETQDDAKRAPRRDSGTAPAVEESAGTREEAPTGGQGEAEPTVIVIAQNQVQAGMIQMVPAALDERNRVAPNATTPVALTVLDFPKVAGVSVDWSIDGGKTWQAAPVSGKGTKWTAKVPGAASGSAVSLRVTAKATTGATSQQTVIGAYGVR